VANCVTASTDSGPLALNKRVHYAFGMVLGVDEFRQEQQHRAWKERLSNLLLHGYGTVCGLQVTANAFDTDVEIRVAGGYALSPRGRWLWVDRDQCALLNRWLRANRAALSPPLGPGRQTLYVNLCYAECDVDLVPIAGQACASDDATRAASRTLESFRVEFAWEPPPQPGEDAVRLFGDLMAQVEIVPASSPPGSPPSDERALLLEAVRAIGQQASPPLSPPAPGPYRLDEATACATIHEALAVWATEICPRLEKPTGEEGCILLACIDLEVDAAGELVFAVDTEGELLPGSVVVDNCVRPVLVSDRLKQELFCLIGQGSPGGGGGLSGPRGPDGVTGPPGLQGLIGPAGPQGLVGPAGPVGPAGLAGPQGLPGVGQGVEGPAGPVGPAGAIGADGADGAVGPAGADGADGAVGPAGADGAIGPIGADGAIGPIGAEGPQGLIGPAGPVGADGPAGAAGPAGADGAVGPAGPQGLIGPPGAGVIDQGDAVFVAGQWGQLESQRQPIALVEPGPITMLVVRQTPADFFTEGGNVALTAAIVGGRMTIIATNLSARQLEELTVTWWAFQQ